VNPSRRRGWFDWLFQIFNRKPYRCQMCSTRFFDAPPASDSLQKKDSEAK
jgi:hypothetical protein